MLAVVKRKVCSVLVIESVAETGAIESQETELGMFTSGIGPIEDYLRKEHNATDDELKYLDEILKLRAKHREPTRSSDYASPSIVLDGFLYHGDLGHASNMGLLKSLGIRHIIDICDCPLDSAIVEEFNVLWINLDDEMKANIRQYFEQTNQFLYECKRKNEKVLVHCQMGISRSSSIVLAYLMK